MHVPDGFVDITVNAATYGATIIAGAIAIKKSSKTLGDKQVPLLGVTAAFIFAAQMLNFPVAGGTSGHFLGAALAAILLGPWNALLVMAAVLVIQCLVFADGGLTALGTNIFNMGIVGGFTAYFVFKSLVPLLPKNSGGIIIATAVASWLSVVIASAACSIELAVSGTSPFGVVLPAMISVHSIIGIGEAIITCAVMSLVLAVRPDSISTIDPKQIREYKPHHA